MDFDRHSISQNVAARKRNLVHRGTLLLRISLVFLLFFTINVQTAFSRDENLQGPSAPMPSFTPQVVDGPPYFINMTDRALSFEAGNQPCAAYGGDGLYYTCFITPTGWTPLTAIDNSPLVGEYASLSHRYLPMYGKTRTAITYYDALNGELKLAYKDGGAAWNILTVPAPVPPYAHAKVAAKRAEPDPAETEQSEAPALAETEQPEAPAAAQAELPETPKSWMSLLKEADPKIVLAPIGVGKHNSIKLDHFGGFHISYYDEYDASLNYAYWGGAGWTFELVDDYIDIGKGVGMWSSIQVDGFRNVHIAYMDEKYDDQKYAFRNHVNGEWTIRTVDKAGGTYNVGSMCSLALDSSNVPYISYLDFSLGNLKVAKLKDLKTNQWVIDKVDTTNYTGWWTSIFVDSNKVAHVSYYNASLGDLKYAKGKPGGSWSISRLQPTLGNVGMFTSIAWDAIRGVPAILYYDSAFGRLMYIYQISSTRWSTPQVVNSNSRDVGLATSLALNNSGVPFISYVDTSNSFMKYARAFGVNWGIYPYTGVYSGLHTSLKLVDNTRPRIAFYDSYSKDLLYGIWNGSYLDVKRVDWYNDMGQYPSLQIASTGIPHISYYDATNKNLMYAFGNVAATQWYTYTIDDVGDVGRYTSLALNSSDVPFVSYYEKTAYSGNLKLWYNWGELTMTVDDGGDLDEDVGMYSSIALDSLGNPHTSYYDYTNGDLKYAFWEGSVFPAAGGGWTISTLQDVGDVGRFTSLKIYQPDDSSHLCYYDYTNGELWYGRRSAGIWEFLKVDDDVDVGLYCSIDLIALDKVAISYYDNGRKDLKIALSYALTPIVGNELYFPLISK